MLPYKDVLHFPKCATAFDKLFIYLAQLFFANATQPTGVLSKKDSGYSDKIMRWMNGLHQLKMIINHIHLLFSQSEDWVIQCWYSILIIRDTSRSSSRPTRVLFIHITSFSLPFHEQRSYHAINFLLNSQEPLSPTGAQNCLDRTQDKLLNSVFKGGRSRYYRDMSKVKITVAKKWYTVGYCLW